jgi:ribonuclease P protein component
VSRAPTLKTSRQFSRVYKSGRSASDGFFVLRSAARGDGGGSVLGLSVSRKVGKAVSRNKIRRRIFEIWREALRRGELKPGFDAVFIARRGAAGADYSNTLRSVTRLMKRRGLL